MIDAENEVPHLFSGKAVEWAIRGGEGGGGWRRGGVENGRYYIAYYLNRRYYWIH